MSTQPIGVVIPQAAPSFLVRMLIPTGDGFGAQEVSIPLEALTSGLVNYSIPITNAQLLSLGTTPIVVFPASSSKAFFPIAAYLQIGGTTPLSGVLSATIQNDSGSIVATCNDATFCTPGYVSSFALAIGATEPNDLGCHLQFGDEIVMQFDADGADADGDALLTISGYIVSQL